MKVWFGTTTSQWLKYRSIYLSINSYLKELGIIHVFDWVEDADKFYHTNYKNRNIHKIYQEVVQAIDQADVVIIEYTVTNFSSSHQINYALLKKKPTLVMRLSKDNPRFADSYLEALKSPYLTVKDYTAKNFKEVIDEFIDYSRLEQGNQRYNIVLNHKQKHFLDWASAKYKRSRSEILRDLVDQQIEDDPAYLEYIKTSE